jgi:hypothetical protein
VYFPLSSPSFLRLLEDAIISPFCFSFFIFKGSLICKQRSGTEGVPGCSGKGQSAYDYCYDSALYAPPLGECEGDCDSDSECDVCVLSFVLAVVSPPPIEDAIISPFFFSFCIQLGLTCFHRSEDEDVPGCSGSNLISAEDYCITPDPGTLVYMGNDYEPAENFPLGECEGDCDSDYDCAVRKC